MGRPKKTDKKNKRGNGEGTIYQRTDGTWCAQITTGTDPLKGTPIRKTVYGKKREDVKNKLIEIQNQVRTQTYADPGKLTLGEWLDTWLEDYMKNSIRQTTYDSYYVQIHKHIKPAIGHIKLKELETTDLQRFYNAKLERGRADKCKNEKGEIVTKEGGLSPRTVRYMHQVIRGALGQAIEEHKLVKSPADAVKLPRNPKKEMKTLSRDDIKVFLEHAKDYRYYAAYYLELASGLRRGEILALRGKDITFSEKMENGKKVLEGAVMINRHLVRVKGGFIYQEPKTQKSKRTVEIPEDAVKVLKAHMARQKVEVAKAGELYENRNNEKERLLFATELGKRLDPKNFTRDFQGCLKHAGLERVRFHDMRHTYATMMLEAGAALNAVQEQLGHHSPTFTAEQYGHVTKKMKKDAAAIMGNILKGAVNSDKE